MYKVGERITMHGLVGKISRVQVNKRIGFNQENNREIHYNLIFENIPEHLILCDDGTDKQGDSLPGGEKEESGGGQG